MSHKDKAAAVLYAKDVARVSAFYAGTANLQVVRTEKDHVVLESPTFQLVVIAIPDRLAASIEVSTPPVRREATPIKLVFHVLSIGEARRAAVALGGELNPVEREWVFQGCTVCDGCDPEGNVVQFREYDGFRRGSP